MARLVKRTTTVEVFEDDDLHDEIESDDTDTNEDEVEADDDAPRPGGNAKARSAAGRRR